MCIQVLFLKGIRLANYIAKNLQNSNVEVYIYTARNTHVDMPNLPF